MTARLRISESTGIAELPVADIAVESPTPGVAIIDVTLRCDAAAPLHWRFGDGTKPPLDIALNEDGVLQSLQLVFQDESIARIDSAQVVGTASEPRFDIYNWPESRYQDVDGEPAARRLSTGELELSLFPASQASEHWMVADRLRLDCDASGNLVGIAIGPLTEQEWREAMKASPPE